jgi:subtilase family serine protease
VVEAIERRVLLSGVGHHFGHDAVRHHGAAQHHGAGPAMHMNLNHVSSQGTSTYVGNGLTPQMVRTAYDFGTSGNEGAGQTIAIVDAYDAPTIAKDLATFDTQFGIAGQNTSAKGSAGSVFNFFSKVNQTGGSSLPAVNGGWAQEISLDVEWAHAMAPAASIVLVEANSSSTPDLLAAVNYAKTVASVVSMSWGGKESSGDLAYDTAFSSPGVTFVASSGDNGGQRDWPSMSPNVVAVGGTTLNTSAGAYVSESGWSGSGGGTSTVEAKPAYQSALSPAMRSGPDVAYDADPGTGFAVYDSYKAQGLVGWQVYGGTSCGAPQWAALIATADQQRAAAGKAPLNSMSNAADPNYARSILAAVYAMYNAGTAYNNSDFHDITTGSAGKNSATTGYDQVTGIGSPFAENLIEDLVNGVA